MWLFTVEGQLTQKAPWQPLLLRYQPWGVFPGVQFVVIGAVDEEREFYWGAFDCGLLLTGICHHWRTFPLGPDDLGL